MNDVVRIDTTFDFREDAGGKDPDQRSPTLRGYHKLLWSKPLPDGRMFALVDTRRGAYLYHRSDIGEFFLASDSVVHTFSDWVKTAHIIQQIPTEDVLAFKGLGYTIGGMMVFPGNKVDGKQTLNGARGFNTRISDRIDLTLECIRRHYVGELSPLSEVIERYVDFFRLFGDFRGYVEFFLLQDLVTADGSAVEFLMHFDDFRTRAVPGDLETYIAFRERSMAFVIARNGRIASMFS